MQMPTAVTRKTTVMEQKPRPEPVEGSPDTPPAGGSISQRATAHSPFSAVRTKQITFPTMRQRDDVAFFVTFLEPPYVGAEIDQGVAGEAKKRPPILCKILNLSNNEPSQLIMNTVLLSILDEAYPDAAMGEHTRAEVLEAIKAKTYHPAWVGKSFECLRTPGEKNYKLYHLWELRVGS